jgi:hypothetical protein
MGADVHIHSMIAYLNCGLFFILVGKPKSTALHFLVDRLFTYMLGVLFLFSQRTGDISPSIKRSPSSVNCNSAFTLAKRRSGCGRGSATTNICFCHKETEKSPAVISQHCNVTVVARSALRTKTLFVDSELV